MSIPKPVPPLEAFEVLRGMYAARDAGSPLRDIIEELERASEAAAEYAEELGYPRAAESLRREIGGVVGSLWAMEGARAWRGVGS